MNEFFKYNPIKEFDLSILDDIEYGEDAVREDIITPLIKSLGYSPSGPNKIVRSRKLVHPYVAIGSKSMKISIIPDYVLEVSGKPVIIVEAKSPKESLDNSKYAEQAYSYAIHQDIRAQYYILCNGKRLILYHVNEYKPLIDIEMRILPHYWGSIREKLSPENVLTSYQSPLKKDFGLHIKRLGFSEFDNMWFPALPINSIAKLGADLYTFSTGVTFDEEYCISFDFNRKVLNELYDKIPTNVLEQLKKPFNGDVEDIKFVDTFYTVNINCYLSKEFIETKDEIFLPFMVKKFS